MLTKPQVQRYSAESGLRDIMIAEKEVVLTFLLQLLSERHLLDRLAFKGGTCLRKMFTGSQGRFSTDLDFTGIVAHDHEDVVLEMMDKHNIINDERLDLSTRMHERLNLSTKQHDRSTSQQNSMRG